jgi:hypothetical protein
MLPALMIVSASERRHSCTSTNRVARRFRRTIEKPQLSLSVLLQGLPESQLVFPMMAAIDE